MTTDYFAVFGLAPTFTLDLAALEKRYFEAQRQYHPDRLAGRHSLERQKAIAQSMLINDAYQTLKDPLKRARQLLALGDVQPDSVKPGEKLLMEMMEFREELQGAADSGTIDRLEQQNDMSKEDTLLAMAGAFDKHDMNAAAELVMRFSYLVKIEDEIRIKRKSIAA